MTDNLFAYTAPGCEYPGYVSINRNSDGDVVVTVRSEPEIFDGIRICRNKKDAGPGDCYPGGPHCNNYCNMAPQKGPMQDRAEACRHVREGQTASFTVPADQWKLP